MCVCVCVPDGTIRHPVTCTHTHTHTHTHTYSEVLRSQKYFCSTSSAATGRLSLSLAVERFGGTRYSSQRGEPGCHRKVTAAVGVFNLEASSGNRRAALMTVVTSGQTSAVSHL